MNSQDEIMMTRLNITAGSFLLILLASLTLAYNVRAQQADLLRMNVDLASFRYGVDTSYVELYYAFSRSALTYRLEDGMYNASVLMNTIIRPVEKSEVLVARTWRVPVQLPDTAGLEQRMMIGRVNFLLAPGRYRVAVMSRDEYDASASDSLEINFEVRAFGMKTPQFSDVELASSIQSADADASNIFYKNTLEVIPNPALLYGRELPNVMYYSELYNIDLDHYLLRSEVVSTYGKTMSSITKQRSGRHSSRVEVGSANIGAIPSGVYTLILSYGDTTGQMKLSQSKTFYVFNPDVPLDTVAAYAVADMIAAEFSGMSEAELDEQFAMANYICSRDERNIWRSLDGSEPKRKFLTKFWRDRDPDPGMPGNEAYEVYKERIVVSNNQFRTAYRQGWRSDRGRVYILYGAPDYVERRSSESDMKPHEIWRYDNIEGGVDFIFVDRGGFNDYELVHSTKRNEIYNIDWQRSASTR
jgi:GWxTD domain-containing protein